MHAFFIIHISEETAISTKLEAWKQFWTALGAVTPTLTNAYGQSSRMQKLFENCDLRSIGKLRIPGSS